MLLCTGPLRAPCGLCSARGGVKKAQALQSRVAAYWADRLVVAVVSLRLSLAWLPALLASMRVPVTTDLRASTPYSRGFMTPVESQYSPHWVSSSSRVRSSSFLTLSLLARHISCLSALPFSMRPLPARESHLSLSWKVAQSLLLVFISPM